MELKLGATVSYFLWSLLLGGILALAYDVLRSARRIVRTSVFGVNMEDIGFFILTGILLFWTAYDKNDGRLRWQGFSGAILGFFLYRTLFRDRLVCVMVWFYQQAVRLGVGLIKIILFPLGIIYKILAKPFLVIGWYSSRGVRRAEGVLRTRMERQRLRRKCQKAEKKKLQKQKEIRKTKRESKP